MESRWSLKMGCWAMGHWPQFLGLRRQRPQLVGFELGRRDVFVLPISALTPNSTRKPRTRGEHEELLPLNAPMQTFVCPRKPPRGSLCELSSAHARPILLRPARLRLHLWLLAILPSLFLCNLSCLLSFSHNQNLNNISPKSILWFPSISYFSWKYLGLILRKTLTEIHTRQR